MNRHVGSHHVGNAVSRRVCRTAADCVAELMVIVEELRSRLVGIAIAHPGSPLHHGEVAELERAAEECIDKSILIGIPVIFPVAFRRKGKVVERGHGEIFGNDRHMSLGGGNLTV